jgi:hypothetical protein
MQRIKVLIFAASPPGTDSLDLDREFREIEEEVRRATFREAVELILVPGARPVDLLRKLNESQPQVVHFSSHGTPAELMLESGEDPGDFEEALAVIRRSGVARDMVHATPGTTTDAAGQPGDPESRIRCVGKTALAYVLRACDQGNLRLIVLNACRSRIDAEQLSHVVDCVVTMSREISDRAAAKFAASFYGALAYGRSVQKAFDQGVARLTVECIAEADTPELVVRAGVDASRLILIEDGTHGEVPARQVAEPQAPFIVPYPRNSDFVGRDEALLQLHRKLSGPGPVGIRPAGLTGMGGIGKTQLAVEYVHRYRDEYPDGIFWIDAAGPLSEGFSKMATDHRLGWAGGDAPRDDQIRAAFRGLSRRTRGLLVLDNVPDPAVLAASVVPGQLLRTFTDHDARITSVAIAPDGRHALSGSLDDSALVVWDLVGGRLLESLRGHEHWISSVALAPDGRWAITGCGDCTVGFWDLEAGRLVQSASGHEAPVTAVATAPDGQRVVSGAADCKLKVWNRVAAQ